MLTTRAIGSAATSRCVLLRAVGYHHGAATPLQSRRFATTDSNNAKDAAPAARCPFTGAGEQRQQSTVAAAAVDAAPTAVELNLNRPTLKKVPSMPIFGSFFIAVPLIGEQLADYHGIPKMTAGNAYDYYPEMRRRFGDLYAKDIPGHGAFILFLCESCALNCNLPTLLPLTQARGLGGRASCSTTRTR